MESKEINSQEERRRFEAFIRHLDCVSHGNDGDKFNRGLDGYYYDHEVQRAWAAWIARASGLTEFVSKDSREKLWALYSGVEDERDNKNDA